MLKDYYKLIFIVLITSFASTQENESKYLFVGHSYGSPSLDDKKMDSSLLNFLNSHKIEFDKIILGGDFIKSCNDQEELDNFKEFNEKYKPYFVIGNHDSCEEIFNLSINTFGGDKYFKLINSNLLLFINTSFKNEIKINETISFINQTIKSTKPKNILIFTHQVIYSKNDFFLRTNSRTNYEISNKVYDEIYNSYYNSEYKFHFFSGDIGAFVYTPFAFYDKLNNFNFYASGLGNAIHNKAISLQIGEEISVQFIDLTSGKIEPKTKYSKIKVQLFQLPKLIASRIRNVFLKN